MKFTCLVGYGSRFLRPTSKTKMLMYQPKANLDEKRLFGKITNHVDPTIRKMSVWGLYWNQNFGVLFWSMIYVALKFKFSTIVSFINEF